MKWTDNFTGNMFWFYEALTDILFIFKFIHVSKCLFMQLEWKLWLWRNSYCVVKFAMLSIILGAMFQFISNDASLWLPVRSNSIAKYVLDFAVGI